MTLILGLWLLFVSGTWHLPEITSPATTVVSHITTLNVIGDSPIKPEATANPARGPPDKRSISNKLNIRCGSKGERRAETRRPMFDSWQRISPTNLVLIGLKFGLDWS